ncbi:MAG: phosphoribosyl-ATP diphosphatase [Myxococcota bacterium]
MSVRLAEPSQVLDRLFEVIERRRDERPEGSYVVSLLAGGLPTITGKVQEEAEEVVQAALHESDDALAREVADLLFHLLVLLAARGIDPEAAYRELARRFGIGGLEEKASRDGRAGRGPSRGEEA